MRPLSFYTKALSFMQVVSLEIRQPECIANHWVAYGACVEIVLFPFKTPQGARLSGDIAVAFEQLWHAVFNEPVVTHAASKCDVYYCRCAAHLHKCFDRNSYTNNPSSPPMLTQPL